MHASSPAISAMRRLPAATVRARDPAQASVTATLMAISRSFNVGPGIMRRTAQIVRIKKTIAVKSQISILMINHTPDGPMNLVFR